MNGMTRIFSLGYQTRWLLELVSTVKDRWISSTCGGGQQGPSRLGWPAGEQAGTWQAGAWQAGAWQAGATPPRPTFVWSLSMKMESPTS